MFRINSGNTIPFVYKYPLDQRYGSNSSSCGCLIIYYKSIFLNTFSKILISPLLKDSIFLVYNFNIRCFNNIRIELVNTWIRSILQQIKYLINQSHLAFQNRIIKFCIFRCPFILNFYYLIIINDLSINNEMIHCP